VVLQAPWYAEHHGDVAALGGVQQGGFRIGQRLGGAWVAERAHDGLDAGALKGVVDGHGGLLAQAGSGE